MYAGTQTYDLGITRESQVSSRKPKTSTLARSETLNCLGASKRGPAGGLLLLGLQRPHDPDLE